MAYLLRMSKPSGKMTKDEMDLVQNIGAAVAPLGARPVDMPMPQAAPMQQPMPQGMPQGAPMNRLAAIQAAANAQMAGQGDAANPNMANIANYFQGRR
jgi:hypothetical protein